VGSTWSGYVYGAQGIFIAILVSALTIIVAALMVSTIRYHSFKKIDLKGRVPFFILLVPVLIIAAIAVDPPQMLFAIFFCYAISGPLLTLLQLRKMRKQPFRARTAKH